MTRSDGTVYFSDPTYGRMARGSGGERDQGDLDFQGLYRITTLDGEARHLGGRRAVRPAQQAVASPPDQIHSLRQRQRARAHIRAFDVAADGSLSNGRVFADGITSSTEPGGPDGMKCDERGNVWVTAPGGVMGLCALGRGHRQGARGRSRSPILPGAAPISTPFS